MVLKKGVTLIELMVVMLILAILMVAMTAALNPANLINKGKDATRKKDLKRIKVAFEEYYNDKGCFPTQELIDDLNSQDCGKAKLYQLDPWPCEPGGGRYRVLTERPNGPTVDCPDWFAALTRLQATSDKDIIKVEGKKYNYCVASTNIECMDYNEDDAVMGASSESPVPESKETEPTIAPIVPVIIPACCDVSDCHSMTSSCNSTTSCSGGSCYYSGRNCPEYDGNNPCLNICKTDSCGR